MKLIKNRTTNTTHLPGDGDTLTLCGETLVRVHAEENATFVDEAWLDDFPEDFGQLPSDCGRCATLADF